MHLKEIFLILVFIILNRIIEIKAQNYISFSDSNAYWSERHVDIDPGNGITEDIYTLFYDGDTTINGYNYHKLFKTGIQNNYDINWSFLSSNYYTHVFVTRLREDSLKHIYIYELQDVQIYDFNLHLNDTLDYLAYRYVLVPGTYVSFIDSIFDGMKYRKKYSLTAPNLANDYISLIEGVGSTFGLMNFTAPPYEHYGYLYCYHDDFSNVILDTVNCSYSNLDNNIININAIVYPNPNTGNNVFIKFNSIEKFDNITLVDAKGTYQKININYLDSNLIHIGMKIPPGIYYLILKNNNNLEISKIIIIQ